MFQLNIWRNLIFLAIIRVHNCYIQILSKCNLIENRFSLGEVAWEKLLEFTFWAEKLYAKVCYVQDNTLS